LKILQYKILDGCRTEERYKMLTEWLLREKYDVVGFNEMNEWTRNEFQREMGKIGFPHTYLFIMESSNYHIGIASKFPIEYINQREEKPFHHGMLHVKIKDTHFIVTHLCPFEAAYRELETGYIANYIQDIKDPLIVMGDLNTLSPLDKTYYEREEVLGKIKSRERVSLQHTYKGKLNYLPMETLLDAGLYDINHEEVIDYSAPTQINGEGVLFEENESKVYVRIDYVLANKPMLDKQPNAKIIRKELAMISDHYPIECQFHS